MKSNSLKNIKVIKEMLEDRHRTQTRTTVGYLPEKDKKRREVGEIWQETLGNGTVVEWEQKNGYRIKRSVNGHIFQQVRDFLKQYPNCYTDCEKKKTGKYSRYDENTRMIHGMCLDCLSKYETLLKINGEYEEYERKKKLDSLENWFKDAEKEKDIIKKAISSGQFVEQDGTLEKWSPENVTAFLQKMDDDFEKLKQSLLQPLLTKDEPTDEI